MKIVVIGGTGLIGSKLVEKLREDGHEPLAASPDTGVNTITGEGLAEALEGADVVVDVANAPVWEDAAVMDFFLTSTRTRWRRKRPPVSSITSCCRSSAPIGSRTAGTSGRRSPRRKR